MYRSGFNTMSDVLLLSFSQFSHSISVLSRTPLTSLSQNVSRLMWLRAERLNPANTRCYHQKPRQTLRLEKRFQPILRGCTNHRQRVWSLGWGRQDYRCNRFHRACQEVQDTIYRPSRGVTPTTRTSNITTGE